MTLGSCFDLCLFILPKIPATNKVKRKSQEINYNTSILEELKQRELKL